MGLVSKSRDQQNRVSMLEPSRSISKLVLTCAEICRLTLARLARQTNCQTRRTSKIGRPPRCIASVGLSGQVAPVPRAIPWLIIIFPLKVEQTLHILHFHTMVTPRWPLGDPSAPSCMVLPRNTSRWLSGGVPSWTSICAWRTWTVAGNFTETGP